jgi:hypothetical protein
MAFICGRLNWRMQAGGQEKSDSGRAYFGVCPRCQRRLAATNKSWKSCHVKVGRSRLYTASATHAWTRSIATVQSGSVCALSGRFSLAAVSLLAVSLARRQIASHAFVLASSIDALFSSGCQFAGNSAFAASTLSSTAVPKSPAPAIPIIRGGLLAPVRNPRN